MMFIQDMGSAKHSAADAQFGGREGRGSHPPGVQALEAASFALLDQVNHVNPVYLAAVCEYESMRTTESLLVGDMRATGGHLVHSGTHAVGAAAAVLCIAFVFRFIAGRLRRRTPGVSPRPGREQPMGVSSRRPVTADPLPPC